MCITNLVLDKPMVAVGYILRTLLPRSEHPVATNLKTERSDAYVTQQLLLVRGILTRSGGREPEAMTRPKRRRTNGAT